MFWGTKPQMIALERESLDIFLDYKKMKIDSQELNPKPKLLFYGPRKPSWMECVKSSGFRGH